MQRYTILESGVLRIGLTEFHPWPRFRVEGIRSDVPGRLHELLTAAEPAPMLWRAEIPTVLLDALRTFPKKQLERLLHLSQTDPQQVLRWSGFCPALLVVEPITLLPRPFSAEETLLALRRGWRAALARADWPADRSTLRILRKVPAGESGDGTLQILRAALSCRTKRTALRHVRRINRGVVDLVSLPYGLINYSLIREVSEMDDCPGDLSGRCLQIEALRDQLGIQPAWPFRSGRLTTAILDRHFTGLAFKMSGGIADAKLRLPDPPLAGHEAEGLRIQALTTVRAIFQEGEAMRNCAAYFIRQIVEGTHYLYHLRHPEVATVLLKKKQGRWTLAEAKSRSNAKDVHPKTQARLERWLTRGLPSPQN